MESKPGERDLIELCLVVRESADNEVTKMASQRFPTRALFIRTPLNSSDAHSVGLILKGVERKLELVGLNVCQLNSESFSFIAEAIRGMKGSIDNLAIGGNFLLHNDVTTICSILHKVNVRLDMRGCFRGEGGEWPYRSADTDEINQIQRSLNSINNENLEVHVELGKPPLKTHKHE